MGSPAVHPGRNSRRVLLIRTDSFSLLQVPLYIDRGVSSHASSWEVWDPRDVPISHDNQDVAPIAEDKWMGAVKDANPVATADFYAAPPALQKVKLPMYILASRRQKVSRGFVHRAGPDLQ